MFVQEGMWTHARNVTNNTAEGDLATLSNEESNALCAIAGETMFSNFKYVAPREICVERNCFDSPIAK